MNLAERIYTLRTERGLSQLELAEALDVSRQSISKWETGAAVPELDKLLAMSRFFGLTVGALLGVEEGTESAPDGEADSGELTPQQIKMVQEIVDRYLAALPENAPRKPKRWVKVLAVAAAIA
ncbi:MAG: helix-turn-helix transcriptional regulator, partial [Oscillospiraceae bacterium]|nr:helix-turn-helix transcriptional regulator [Oscillospiraceae bacterium]